MKYRVCHVAPFAPPLSLPAPSSPHGPWDGRQVTTASAYGPLFSDQSLTGENSFTLLTALGQAPCWAPLWVFGFPQVEPPQGPRRRLSARRPPTVSLQGRALREHFEEGHPQGSGKLLLKLGARAESFRKLSLIPGT